MIHLGNKKVTNIILGTTPEVSKTFRDLDISSTGAIFEDAKFQFSKVEGKTVKWNQLVKNGNFSGTTYWDLGYAHGTFTTADNIATYTPTSTGDNFIEQKVLTTLGHYYYFSVDVKKDNYVEGSAIDNRVAIFYHGTTAPTGLGITSESQTGHFVTRSTIFTPSGTNKNLMFVRLYNHGGNITHQYKNMKVADLTLIYGAGNEPSTVEQFLADFPAYNDYVDYSEGTLETSELTGIRVNQTLPLTLDFPSKQTLDGVGTVNDEIAFIKQADGSYNAVKTKRFGIVNLGELNWSSSINIYFYSTGLSDALLSENAHLILSTSKYIQGSTGRVYDSNLYFCIGYGGFRNSSVCIHDNEYNNADDFKAAMKNVYLVYELANPVVTTIMTGLTETQVRTFLEVVSTVEILGNDKSRFVRPSLIANTPVLINKEVKRLYIGQDKVFEL